LAILSAYLAPGDSFAISTPGSTASFGDSAPAQSPIQVGISFTSGTKFSFTTSGLVSNGPCCAAVGPEGGGVLSHDGGAQNGISDITAPINSLLGVFLGNDQPNLSPAPGALNFSTAASRDFVSLSPALKQVFYIGNGLTSTNAIQEFIAPTGATRLFLGTMDGQGWFNNFGSFSVRVTATQVPEPTATVSLLGFSALGLGAVVKRKKQQQVTVKA
jgi:hypothetical protein